MGACLSTTKTNELINHAFILFTLAVISFDVSGQHAVKSEAGGLFSSQRGCYLRSSLSSLLVVVSSLVVSNESSTNNTTPTAPATSGLVLYLCIHFYHWLDWGGIHMRASCATTKTTTTLTMDMAALINRPRLNH